MLLDTVRNQFNSLYKQSEYRRVLKIILIGAVAALWIFSRFVTSVVSVDETILITLLLVLFSMEIVETDTFRIEELLASQTRALGAHRNLKNQIDNIIGSKPERIHILGYTGSSALLQTIIGEITDRGAKVYLLYQHPSYTYNEKEQDLGIDTIKYLYRFHEMDENIELRFYDEPASLMGVRSDKGITLGWYTYSDFREQLNSSHRAVQGPENEALLFPHEDRRQFPVMDSFFSELYTHLWLSSRSLKEICEDDDSPEKLQSWIKFANKKDQERRREWIERTDTENITDRPDIFPDKEPLIAHPSSGSPDSEGNRD